MSLKGKVAIVTGAGSGIGRATAVLFSMEGANVALVGRTLEALKETLSELEDKRGLVVQADVTKAQDASRMVDETLRGFGNLDILVNNAGVDGPFKPFTEVSEEEWNYVMNVNLKGVFLSSKFAALAMKKNRRGTITNVAGNWGLVAAPNASPYCASKAGVIGLTRAMAMDCAQDGITVNCICPGNTNAGMELKALAKYSEERRHAIAPKLIPVEQIAHGILYLVSDEATMSTGTALILDNGATAGEAPRLLMNKEAA